MNLKSLHEDKQPLENSIKLKKSSPRNLNEKTLPLGVKILSILYYAEAVGFGLLTLFCLSLGILLFLSPDFIDVSKILFLESFNLADSILGAFLLMATSLFILLTLLHYFLAKNLWKGKNWARIIVIVFSILGVGCALFATILGNFEYVLTLVISAIIGAYLIYYSEVKSFFGVE